MGRVVAKAPLPGAHGVGGLDIRPLRVVKVGEVCARCVFVRRSRSRDWVCSAPRPGGPDGDFTLIPANGLALDKLCE